MLEVTVCIFLIYSSVSTDSEALSSACEDASDSVSYLPCFKPFLSLSKEARVVANRSEIFQVSTLVNAFTPRCQSQDHSGTSLRMAGWF
eukprot:3774868-Amphidinium_carterae.2